MRIGIDVGGTFTDFLIVHDDGSRQLHKTSSIPADPSTAVVQGLREIADARSESLDVLLSSVEAIVHGTTVTTNALLTRSGATTGLLATEGFRDVLPMRDGTREAAYDNRISPPVSLVPRYLRLPAGGRIDYTGAEVTPLADDDVRAAAQVFREQGVDAVAISFLHAHADSEHERRAEEILVEELPGAYLTRASELISQVRYYDRTSTAVLNSYVGPIITRYLRVLTEELESAGFGGVLLLMQSNGGVATPEALARRAALSLLSGPASGPTAGLLEVQPHGWDRCLTVDMGGTSFDAAVVNGGEPLVMTDGVIDRGRIALPMVDIHTIGAGGGSIAYVDEGGLLRVGPQSAGADPGPACYGRGGTRATVTDADVLLGFVDPTTFLGGEIALDVEAARDAIKRDVAEPLGLDVIEAAAGIYDVVNVSMAAGIREVTVRRGLDPRDFPVVVAGGAGPVHAASIAQELKIPMLVTPRESSIFCAAGMMVCDFKHDYVAGYKSDLRELDLEELSKIWTDLAKSGLETLQSEGLSDDKVTYRPSLDMRYRGQWYEINVAVDESMLHTPDRDVITDQFHKLHDELFGYLSPEMAVDVLNIRLTAVGETPKPSVQTTIGAGADGGTYLGEREIWSVDERRMVSAAVYEGNRLPPGFHLSGPAIIELGTSTIVVPVAYDMSIDKQGSFVLMT